MCMCVCVDWCIHWKSANILCVCVFSLQMHIHWMCVCVWYIYAMNCMWPDKLREKAKSNAYENSMCIWHSVVFVVVCSHTKTNAHTHAHFHKQSQWVSEWEENIAIFAPHLDITSDKIYRHSIIIVAKSIENAWEGWGMENKLQL